jgi:hypothetical protein
VQSSRAKLRWACYGFIRPRPRLPRLVASAIRGGLTSLVPRADVLPFTATAVEQAVSLARAPRALSLSAIDHEFTISLLRSLGKQQHSTPQKIGAIILRLCTHVRYTRYTDALTVRTLGIEPARAHAWGWVRVRTRRMGVPGAARRGGLSRELCASGVKMLMLMLMLHCH